VPGVSPIHQGVDHLRGQSEEILADLATGSLVGADAPFRVYLTCYHVLQAHDDSRSLSILQMAHELLQARAATMGDERLRRLFLEHVPAHRELVSAFNQWYAAPDEEEQ
jgi:hypothetical protein